MDSYRYKQVCESPNVFSREQIEQTIVLVGKEISLRKKLEWSLQGHPIEKPPQHGGGAKSDFFRLKLTREDLKAIVDKLTQAEVSVVAPDGETTQEASETGQLLDLWRQYLMVNK